MFESNNNRKMISALPHKEEVRPAVTGILALLAALLWSCATPQETTAPRPTLPDDMTLRRTDLLVTPLTWLNSPQDDFGVTMPLDTTLVFFTSNRSGSKGVHSIYWSRRTETGWRKPELAVEINNSNSNGVPSIAPNGESMFLAGCDYGLGDCDLYEVESGVRGSVSKETVAWTVPSNMGLQVNTAYWDSQPSIAADGSVIFFASDRPGGFGGRDIWFSLRMQDGSWSRAHNAGPEVNTDYDEVTPTITPDCRTLFFASNGLVGLGGFDLFRVDIDLETGYISTVPAVNLGHPLNSAEDDIGLTISSDGSTTFFASNRSGGLGGFDIYQVNIPPVEIEPVDIVRGIVRDESGSPIFARIQVTSLSTGNVIGRFQTNPENGTYAVVLRRGENYAITASAPGRLFHSRQINVSPDLAMASEDFLEYVLPHGAGSTELLLFFAPNSVTLERESTVDLDYVVTFLKENPETRIEIVGHTDSTGSIEENERISLERARAVKSYLVGNRIRADRIDVSGQGSTQPSGDNTTAVGRGTNRRVEMRVVSKPN